MDWSTRVGPLRLPRFDSEERALLRVQQPMVWALSIILLIGYSLQHELRFVAERQHLRILFRSWDGLAWLVWPFAAPMMLLLIRRYPLKRGIVRRNLGRLLLGSGALYLVVSNLRLLLRLLPNLWIDETGDLPLDLGNYIVSILVLLPLDLLTYSGFFSLSFAVNYYFKHRQRVDESMQLKLRTAQLESELAQAELKALRGQLHPHFLFNSFNAVTTLMRQKRNDAAIEVLVQLGALLRLAIDRTGQQELALADECDFARRYLDIERIRFGEKLRLVYDLDPATLPCRVPNLLLQPLVENAIKHGLSHRTQPGTIRLASRRTALGIEIEIENDGPDHEPLAETREPARQGGVGLANTRSRLDRNYGEAYRLTLARRPDGGMLVTLELPWRPPSPLP